MEDRSLARYEGLADWYDDYHGEIASRENGPDTVLAALAGDHAGPCLDIGCGTGLSSRALARLGRTVVGIDSSADQLAVARARCAWVVQGDAHRLPFASSSLPEVSASFLHTDVDDFPAVAAEISRVLHRGGRFTMVGVHPCFVGHHVDSVTRSESELRILPGYREAGWVFDSPQFGPGIRGRIGARHVPLADLLNGITGAGFAIERVLEAGDALVPWMLAILARKA